MSANFLQSLQIFTQFAVQVTGCELLNTKRQDTVHNITYKLASQSRQHVNMPNRNRVQLKHGDTRQGKRRGNWRMQLVASIQHTTSEHGVSSITTADAYISAASSRLNWCPCQFKWAPPFRRKTKSGFCACHHISNAVYQWYQFSLQQCVVTGKTNHQNVAYRIRILHQGRKMVNLNAFTVAQATSCTYVEQYESRLMCNLKTESLHQMSMCR
jgi:hypothetical protein